MSRTLLKNTPSDAWLADAKNQAAIERLYLHFPHCQKRCHYCDFYVVEKAADPDTVLDDFLSSILRELDSTQGLLAPSLKSIYFGGGTPSLYGPSRIGRVLEAVKGRISDKTEVTLELNPDSLGDQIQQALLEYQKSGINRMSVGVQSLCQAQLSWLDREHSAKQAIETLKSACKIFPKVSCDFLLGVPGVAAGDLIANLENVLDQVPKIGQFTTYPLTLKEGNPKYRELPTSDLVADQMEAVAEFLESKGFNRYEVGSYAKHGQESDHNQAYWTGEGYLGLGPSASSFFPKLGDYGVRKKNSASLGEPSR